MKFEIFSVAIIFVFSISCQREKTSVVAETEKTSEKTETAPKKEPLANQKLKTEPASDKLDMTQARQDQIAGKSSYKTYYESGYSKHNSGDFVGAISDFNKSIELNPEFAEAWHFRGMSKYKSGDKAGACADWQRSSQLGNTASHEMIGKYC